MYSISPLSIHSLSAFFWRIGAITLLILAFCVPGLCVGIDERLLTKDTSPTLTFGITPGYTIPNNSVTLSGGLYNFLVSFPEKEIIIERSVEYGPYEPIATVMTGDDGTFLYLDTPPGRAEHKVYYRAIYVEDGKRIIETEPIYVYLGTPETVQLFGSTDEAESAGESQIREISGYRFMIDSVLSDDGEGYLVVTTFTSTTLQGATSGIMLASPCGDEFEMLAIGISSSDGTIEFPALDGCSDYYMLCPVVDGVISSCTEPFSYIAEVEEISDSPTGMGDRNSQIIRDWLATSQFGDLLPNSSEPISVLEVEVSEGNETTVDSSATEFFAVQIGTEPLMLELYQVQEAQRGVPTLVEVLVTSQDGAPVSDAEITLFLSSDLVYWYNAAQSITDESGIADFHVSSGRIVTLKARAAFLGNETYAYGESNTIVIIS